MSYPGIIIKAKRDASIKRRHPWVFSGAIEKIELDEGQELAEGDVVSVYNQKRKFLARGHFSEGSIAVRILTFEKEDINQVFFEKRIGDAYALRASLGLTDSKQTNAYRLVHGEGDHLGGLIVDIYHEVAVIQAHSVGMLNSVQDISLALQTIYSDKLKSIYNKSSQTIHQEELNVEDKYVFGEATLPYQMKEHGISFQLDWETGQKTGFFLDQRENRKLVGQYAKNRKVLNTFCYSGGFSLYALDAGAQSVCSVDSSEIAVELANQNVALLKTAKERHTSSVSDSLDFLKSSEDVFDLIILDPPAYAKHPKARHRAVQAYRRLNEMAMKKISKDGILFTFSCSQAIDRKLFEDTIRAAAIDARREVTVLHHLSQGADHPVNIYHPEGEYLKGLVLRIS